MYCYCEVNNALPLMWCLLALCFTKIMIYFTNCIEQYKPLQLLTIFIWIQLGQSILEHENRTSLKPVIKFVLNLQLGASNKLELEVRQYQ